MTYGYTVYYIGLQITELYLKLDYTSGQKGTAQALSPDLFVIFAESAININLIAHHELIEEALTFYTALKPKQNQFMARSYLCHAHLYKPNSTRDREKLEKCSSYILKAVEFGKKSSRYYFLVMNASILFWKLARPFLVLQSIHLVVNSLGAIVKALTLIDDHNKKWLLSLSMTYVESLFRNSQVDLAGKETQIAIKLAKAKCPELLPEIVSKLSNYGLVKSTDMESLPTNLVLIYDINTLKSKLKSDPQFDSKTLVKNIEDILKKIVEGKLDPDTRNDLLLEVIVISLEHRLSDLAETSLNNLQAPFTDVNFQYRVKFAEADLIVKKLGAGEQSYKKSVLQVRKRGIAACQEALVCAIEECDSATVQSGCTTLWNLCLPMLQPNLRFEIQGALRLITATLESLQSMLVLLRCQVHIELAKCYQDQQKLVDALENFNKALNLDPDGQYKESVLYHLKCINLKTNLYKKPESVEEKAGFLLEQAKCAKDSRARIQPLLLKVGEYLAPNTFNWGMKELSENSKNCSSLVVLRDKVTKYKEAKEKGLMEMNRLREANTHERFVLWADAAKLARKEEVWDVALTASRFALWFEHMYTQHSTSEDDSESLARKSTNSRSSTVRSDKNTGRPGKGSKLSNFGKQNAILLAELNFIYAESLIYFLQQEDIALGEQPKLPLQVVWCEAELETHMDYPHWRSYCTWISDIQEECVSHFVKGGQQGLALKEAWLLNNSCVYIWNYLKRTIDANRHDKVIDWLLTGYNLLIAPKADADYVLVCQFAEAIMQGYLTKHKVERLLSGGQSPSPSRKNSPSRSRKGTPGKPKSGKKSATPVKGKGGKKDAKDTGLNLDPVLTEDITKAIQISETVYQQIVGRTTVGLHKRKALLCLWVKCRQVLGLPLKTLLPDEENTDEFSMACKSLVAVEVNHLNTNGYYVFPNVPSMQDTLKMIDSCEWPDKLIELEIWTKVATLSLKLSNKELIDTCCDRISKLQDHADLKKPGNKLTANKLLCYHNLILGKSELSFGNKTTIEERLPALGLFATAAQSAEMARDYALALEVVQHFWNAILPHLRRKNERGLLKGDLLKILRVIANLAPDKNQKITTVTSKHQREIELRAHLYSSIFIIYLDEKDWSSGLEEAEKAALALPRPTHPLVLKYRALFKVNLGISPNGDMAKLERVEQEDTVSDMWHRVAMSSTNKEEQLYSHQQAIMLLQIPELRVKKVEAIIRLAEWLFVNQFPITDVLDQLEWALDIAVGLKSETKGTVLMPVEEQSDDQSVGRTRSPTQTVRTRRTMSTTGISGSEEKLEVLSKPRPLLSYVEETMEKMEEVTDLQRADLIARVLVIRSKMVLYSGGNAKQSVLLAYQVYTQILQQSLMNLDSGNGEEKPNTRDGKRPVKGGNTKLTSKSQLQFSLPESLTDWAIFQLPANANDQEQLKERLSSNTMNRVTFPEPELSLHYVEELCEQLELFGLLDHLLPMYVVQELLAVSVLDNKHMASLIHHKAAAACQKLQLLQGFTHHIEQASSVSSNEEFETNLVDLQLYKDQVKQMPVGPMGLDETSAKASNLITGIKLHHIQVKKAEILISSGDFTSAIAMLEQALPHIELLDNPKSREEYHYTAALLAAAQSDHKAALNHLGKVLTSRHDLDTSVKLMSKVVDVLITSDLKTAALATHKFVDMLQDLHAKYKCHSCQIQYTISKLTCQIVKANVDGSLKDALTSIDIENLLEQCSKFEKPITIFSNLGFPLDAARAMLWLSQVKFRLSASEHSGDFQKCMYLEAVDSAQTALKLLNTERKQMENLGVAQAKMSLFVHLTIELHCHLSNLYHRVSRDVIREEKRFRIADSQKENIDKEIESYIAEPVRLTNLDEKWQRICYTSAEQAKVHGDNAVRLANKIHLQVGGEAQLALGTALGDVSHALFEDSLDQWERLVTGEEIVTREIQKEITSLKYLTSSMEFLSQSVQISLLKQDHKNLQSGCLEIIDRLGFSSPQSSVQYLCLYQSSLVSVWLRGLLKKALCVPSKSQVGAIVTQMEQAYSAGHYQLYSTCFEQLLKSNSAWKRLLVFENHSELVKEIDEKQYFLVFQHSPCKRFLYSSLLQGTKTAGKTPLENPLTEISRATVDIQKLESISRMFEGYKTNLNRYLVKFVHLLKLETQAEERKALLDQLCVEEGTNGLDDVRAGLEEEREKLSTFYRTIVSELWAYIAPAVEPFKDSFSRILEQDSSFVLLADSLLQILPLEATPLSKIGNVKLYTRDFSLQSHYHRLLTYAHSKNGENPAQVDAKKGTKTPMAGSARGERTRNLMDKRIFLDKIPLLPPTIDSNNIRYILNEDSRLKAGELKLGDEFAETIKETQNKTSRWSGSILTDSRIGPVEVQEILDSSSGFVYLGTGRLTNLISAEQISCLSSARNHLHIIAEGGASAHGFRHSTAIEGKKDGAIRALETPECLAALLFLTGSVLTVINTTSLTSDSNVRMASTLIRTVSERDTTIGTALYLTRYPPTPETSPTPATPVGKGAKGKSSKGKQDGVQDGTVVDVSLSLPDELDPDVYCMAGFGVPHVTLSDPLPVAGKK